MYIYIYNILMFHCYKVLSPFGHSYTSMLGVYDAASLASDGHIPALHHRSIVVASVSTHSQ